MKPVSLRSIFLPLLFLFLVTPFIETQAEAQSVRPESLSGRWTLAFEDDSRRIEMPADLRVIETGRVRLVLLGKTGGDEGLFQGIIAGDKIDLSGSFNGNDSRIELKMTAQGAGGTLKNSSAIYRITGSRDSAQLSEVPVNKYPMLLDAVWNGVNLYFYDPRLKGVDWNAAKTRYLPLVKAAQNDGEIAVVLRKLLRELGSSHTELHLSTGKKSIVHKTEQVAFKQIDSETGYLAIRYFSPERLKELDADLDRAMDQAIRFRSLVIDLRGNDGENLEAALAALNFLLPDGRAILYFASRERLIASGLNSIDQITPSSLPTAFVDDYTAVSKFKGAGIYLAGGKYKSAYQGKIAVLIDENCAGSCEVFAEALKDAGAHLIGRKTPGRVLLSQDVDFQFVSWSRMARGTVKSWLMELPKTDIRMVKGTKLEGKGIKPDIEVIRSANDDADLKAALRWLKR